MTTEALLDILREGLKVAVLLSGPVLLFGLVVGVATNVLQAVTGISETTLSVVPKLLAMALAFALFAPWMIDIISDFTIQILSGIPNTVR